MNYCLTKVNVEKIIVRNYIKKPPELTDGFRYNVLLLSFYVSKSSKKEG